MKAYLLNSARIKTKTVDKHKLESAIIKSKRAAYDKVYHKLNSAIIKT
jgi:hypothetical protein